MLPKLTSHIFHHTSRAAAALQSQSSYIRNALQLPSQASSAPSGGIGGYGGASSSWGSQGAGPGGAKYHAGSRFYNGYTGSGRALTQANASTSLDGSTGQNDDTDELTSIRLSLRRPSRPRLRSNSLSINFKRHEPEKKIDILSNVQMHARFSHAFASDGQAIVDPLLAVVPPSMSLSSTRPPLVRRNSTTASIQAANTLDSPPLPSSPRSPTLSTDPATPQSTIPPSISASDDPDGQDSPEYIALRKVRNDRDANGVLHEVHKLRTTAINPTAREFNMALEGLQRTRNPGDPLTPILETYNDMVSRSIYPTVKTYSIVIQALTTRDREVQMMIHDLQSLHKRLSGQKWYDVGQKADDEQEIAKLRKENNFTSALSLFVAAMELPGVHLFPYRLYHELIESAANHGSVDAALTVFAHLERRPDLLPNAWAYGNLITVYTNVGDIRGAKEVFSEFETALRAGRVSLGQKQDNSLQDIQRQRTSAQVHVWNKMITAYFRCGQPVDAVGLLEQMMDRTSGSDIEPPPPNQSTFTAIIAGFCHLGDTKTALGWFEQLLQSQSNANAPSPASVGALRPDQDAWSVMFDQLAEKGMIDDLNRLFTIYRECVVRDELRIFEHDRRTVFDANVRALDSSEVNRVEEILDFLSEQILRHDSTANHCFFLEASTKIMLVHLIRLFIRHNRPDGALIALRRYVDSELDTLRQADGNENDVSKNHYHKLHALRKDLCDVSPDILDLWYCSGSGSLDHVLQIARLSDSAGLLPYRLVAPYYLHAFELEAACKTSLTLSSRDWTLLLYASAISELPVPLGQRSCPDLPGYAFKGTASLLQCMQRHDVPLADVNGPVIRMAIRSLLHSMTMQDLRVFFEKLGPVYQRVLEAYAQSVDLSPPTPASPNSAAVQLDIAYSRYIDKHVPANREVSPLQAYARFTAGLAKGIYPVPATIGRLINALGRMGEWDKVRTLYDTGQLVLSTLEGDKEWQSQCWFQIEDSMIIAYAHGGNLEAAHVHRKRILEQDGVPSADAYGALIQAVKDTTDDCWNALSLFRESQMIGVRPNLYLFNTIISKLAKARKADFAIDLFQQMKVNGFQPSSITFGAVIAACARVGDTQSAELLFEEMTKQSNFRPRIPPYNTMIQMYTATKPNRLRALHYYDQLCRAGIEPTSHTYKLLIDAYGTIEPIDLIAMEKVFKELECNREVPVQGVHWASLINAYGCVKKDLERAIAIFDSIQGHPSAAASPTILPDAVVYEAMINVLVTHRRADLIPRYIQRLRSSNVHMTAYIANFMIKGYAAAGDLQKAREVFEQLEDPPEGVAAPNNHAPHQGGPVKPVVASTSVYREPSTWEAMVRAELGSGNRDNATALIQRLQSRKFPVAVQNRISGIMLDDPASPSSSFDSPPVSDGTS